MDKCLARRKRTQKRLKTANLPIQHNFMNYLMSQRKLLHSKSRKHSGKKHLKSILIEVVTLNVSEGSKRLLRPLSIQRRDSFMMIMVKKV